MTANEIEPSALARLEEIIRGVDPEFRPSPKPAGLKAALAALAVTREHAAAASIAGQSVSGMLATAHRQVAELGILIKTIAASAPAGDVNVAKFESILSGLGA